MAKARPKPLNLALQGGGAHGAFSWGVIDRLLEDGRVSIEAISGTSAGAMNAVVYADGHVKGGPEGAREALTDFWHAISVAALANPVQRTPLDMLMGNWSLDFSPAVMMFDLVSRVVSPYDFNPLNINPLITLLENHIDFDCVQNCTQVKLFVSATNVHTGRVRIFENAELSADAVMASACLPYMFQAVEIDGVPYWDGGYIGNPALYPFFYETATPDIMLVQINPIERTETPRTARDILNRMNEITFNSALVKELRSIEFVTRLIDKGKLDDTEYMRVRMHHIDGGELLKPMSVTSKLNAEWKFLTHLRDIGRTAAAKWLDENFDALGHRATFDLRSILH
jgi:NTE family protein